MYSDHLLSAGHEVESVDTGEAGIERLRTSKFDILVTDVILPGMDGLEVLAQARQIDPDIGVIMISALDMVDPAVRAIKAGAFDYLVKPASLETLRLAVTRCAEYRSLLWENIDLKKHLALSQAGARIAAATEHNLAYHQAAEALVAHTDSLLILLVSFGPEGLVVKSAVGSGTPLDFDQVSQVDSWLQVNGKDGTFAVSPRAPKDLRTLGDPSCIPVTVPGDKLSILCFPGANQSFDEKALRVTHFLANHLAQALQALDRLETAQNLAYTDDLTQLFNGRYLHRILEQYVEHGEASGKPFAVLFLDLDNFKAINDEHGHLVGSELLVEVAALIKSKIRTRDIAVRYGGDEYVLVLPESDREGALRVAERVRQGLEEHLFLSDQGKAIRLTASVGVACYPEHTTDKRRLMELADHAMYRGKRGHRNVVYMATPDKVVSC